MTVRSLNVLNTDLAQTFRLHILELFDLFKLVKIMIDDKYSLCIFREMNKA